MAATPNDNHANDDRAKYIALVTCLMSIPLLFPPRTLQGLPLNWWLLSIYAVPILIVLGLIITAWTLVTSERSNRSSLRWNLLGIVVGVIALVIEVILIRMPSALP